MRNENKGFTLVELLIVVAILAIFASLAIPRLFPQREKAAVAEAIGFLSSIRQGEAAYELENGSYLTCGPGDVPVGCWNKLGLEDPGVSSRYFTYAVTAPRTAGGGGFLAVATRNATNATFPGGTYLNQRVEINELGDYTADTGAADGIHALSPQN